MTAIRPKTIVEFRGPSPDCPCPERHASQTGGALGIVDWIAAPRPEHDRHGHDVYVVALERGRSGWARLDELEVVR